MGELNKLFDDLSLEAMKKPYKNEKGSEVTFKKII